MYSSTKKVSSQLREQGLFREQTMKRKLKCRWTMETADEVFPGVKEFIASPEFTEALKEPMQQSKKRSFLEAFTNLIVGAVINICLTFFVFNWIYDFNVTLKSNLTMTVIITVFSFIRLYTIRRMFNR